MNLINFSLLKKQTRDEEFSFFVPHISSLKLNADEKNRTSTRLPPQASETCASTSSATSASGNRIEIIQVYCVTCKIDEAGNDFYG